MRQVITLSGKASTIFKLIKLAAKYNNKTLKEMGKVG